MTITIRNDDNAQARRTFKALASKMLPGGTWNGDNTVGDSVARITLTDPRTWALNADLIAEDGGGEFDVTITTSYYTCATVLGFLSRQMRERAEIDGRPADEVCEERNAYQNA